MSDNKFQILSESGDITIREGKALELKQPLKPEIIGEIETPATWAESQDFDKSKSHAIVRMERGSVSLYEDCRNPYGGLIKGTIVTTEALNAFGINDTKYYTSKELAKFLKRNRMHFPDKEEAMKIVNTLNQFKAKVDKQIEQSQNDRGSKKNLLEQVVESNAPESFKLYMPIIGREKRTFNVEVGLDVTDGGVQLWLESIELLELIQAEKENSINEVVRRIESEGITIIYS